MRSVWFTVVGIVFVLLLAVVGASMVVRFVLRRRISRAEGKLPPSDFSGTAMLVGTNFDEDLRGIGALAVTRDSLVFVAGSDQRLLHIPRDGLTASEHRRTERQRTPSLRVQWAQNIAQFEVNQPSVSDWVQRLSRPG